MARANMNHFCGSDFWDSNLTWYTEHPELTSCFQQTVLVWSPTVFFWLLLPLDLYYTFTSKYRDIPWSWNNISKIVVNSLLILLCLFDLTYVSVKKSNGAVVYDVDVYTPIIKCFTWTGCLMLVFCHKKMGRMSSELLCLYWFTLCVLGIPQFTTDLYAFQNDETDIGAVKVTYMMSYCLWALMFFINFFADSHPRQSAYPRVEKSCPESWSSFPSRLFYTWFDSLALTGFRKPLEDSDIWNLNYSETTNVTAQQFDLQWNRATTEHTKYKGVEAALVNNDKPSDGELRVDFIQGKRKRKPVGLLVPLCRAFAGPFLVGSCLKFIQQILTFGNPLLLEWLIDFMGSDEPEWRGYLYALTLFASNILQTLLLSVYNEKMLITGLHIKTGLMSAIYRKALRISKAARKEAAVGEIVNLIAVDCQRFIVLTPYLNMIWALPLQLIVCFYLLWLLLGPSLLAGVALIIATIPLNGLVGKKIKQLTTEQMKCKDERVKTMSEILNGIKVLKLYAWEPCFEEQVTNIRQRETSVLKRIAYYMSTVATTWFCTPFLVGLLTFVIFVYSDENNVLDAKVAFVSLALMNMIRLPLCMLPFVLMESTQAWVSMKRISKFLNLEELDPDSVTHDTNEDDALVMEKCRLSWDDEGDVILKDISLRVKEGSLVAVVGTVGCGKSSLISAFLGEMQKISGRVNTKGTIAYVPQVAWIQNATVRDNILFGKPYNDVLYRKVIQACELTQDLDMFPAGDQTEIGEKGINLSGGQKQRVSLARAVYSDSDVYLLDDPLSAVDSHVGKHIFEDVIGPTGILQKKTRLLVTHGITYLPDVDVIVVLKNGTVSEIGNYQQLMDRKSDFSDFILTHLQNQISGDNEDLDKLKEMIGSNEKLCEIMSDHQKYKQVINSTDLTATSNQSIVSMENGVKKSESMNSLRLRKSVRADNKNNGTAQPENLQDKLVEEEKAEIGTVKWSVYKQYIISMGMFFCCLVVTSHVVFEALSIGTYICLSFWSSDPLIVINGTQDTSRINRYIAVYTVLGLGQGIMSILADLTPALGCWLAAVSLHRQLLHTTMRLPVSFFDTTPSGRILARFSKDLDILDCIVPRNVTNFSWTFFFLLGTLFIISYSTPIFLVTIAPIFLIYYFIQKYYVPTTRQLNRLESISRSPIYNHFSESFSGASCIRAFDVADRFVSESEERIDKNTSYFYAGLIGLRWMAVRLDMLGSVIIMFSAIFAVQARGWISASLAGLSVSHALQITEQFNNLVKYYSEVEVNIVAAERVKEYSDVKHEAAWEVEGTKVSAEWPEKGEVELKDFKVRYREGLDCVLKGISFCIRGGEKVGVVGRTGAGKSSLTLSLFRIIEPAAGSIHIDNLDISKLGLQTLRSRLTIIPQDPVLFSGNLRMNLDPFRRHSDHQIWRALELSHLKDFVKGHNTGLEFQVSEAGDNLSVGQRQLVCLARALLRKTKVLILDEATAAVDLETDNLIQKTIRSEFADCTILTIAHRINTIMDSDRVMVLDKGIIMEFDSPENLLKNRESIFYSMSKDAGLA